MDYSYSYDVESGGMAALLAIYIIAVIVIYVIAVIGLWKMYVKAGRPGWAAIIPVYNWWVWIEIIGRPKWWFWALVASILISWIPVIGWILNIGVFVLFIIASIDMAKCFGKGTGFGIGLAFLSFIFAPILGFGDARYVGAVAAGPQGPMGMGTPPPPPSTGTWAAPPAPPEPPATPQWQPQGPVTPQAQPPVTPEPQRPVTPQPPMTPPTPPSPPAGMPPAAPPVNPPPAPPLQ